MSKIILHNDSEIIHSYFQTMNKIMEKQAALGVDGVVRMLRAGMGKLDDLLKPLGLNLDDFIRQAIKSGAVSADELAQLTGKSKDDISKILSEGGQAAAKITPEASKLTDEISESAKIIARERQNISQVGMELSNLDGKTLDEVNDLYQKLKKSRALMKSEVSRAQALAKRTQKKSSELTNLLEESRAAQVILERTADKVPLLEKTISNLTKQVSDSQKTVQKLTQRSSQLSQENKKLLEEISKQTELAAYYKGLSEAAESVAPAEAKAAAKIADDATKEAARKTKKLTDLNPKAVEEINQTSRAAKVRGIEKAKAKSKGFRATNLTDRGVQESLFGEFKSLMGKALGEMGHRTVRFLTILGLAGASILFVWRSWFSADGRKAEADLDSVRDSQVSALTLLRSLKFKDGSEGQARTSELINAISQSNSLIQGLSEESSEVEIKQAMSDLDSLNSLLEEYLEDYRVIAQDLEIPDGWSESLTSLANLQQSLANLKQSMGPHFSNSEEIISQESRGVGQPAAKSKEVRSTQAPTHVPQIETILNQEVDIGHLNRGMRSAAPRIIEKVINSPEGLAFIDPDGIWGGWLPKTPVEGPDGQIIQNQTADYVRALKYLYLNRIFNRRDLRQFIRKNLPKAGRRGSSGWREAVKHYRGRINKYANLENNVFFTQNFIKPANSYQSSVIFNNNMDNLDMQKKADQISKEYFQDLVQGIEDQYAKSYYSEFKEEYESKDSKTEADYAKLYQSKESDVSIVGKAHPKTIDLVDSMGRGGVVENQIEQQRHNKQVALSVPSGNFLGRKAQVVQDLVKLADKTDEQGMREASDLIDLALKELSFIDN